MFLVKQSRQPLLLFGHQVVDVFALKQAHEGVVHVQHGLLDAGGQLGLYLGVVARMRNGHKGQTERAHLQTGIAQRQRILELGIAAGDLQKVVVSLVNQPRLQRGLAGIVGRVELRKQEQVARLFVIGVLAKEVVQQFSRQIIAPVKHGLLGSGVSVFLAGAGEVGLEAAQLGFAFKLEVRDTLVECICAKQGIFGGVGVALHQCGAAFLHQSGQVLFGGLDHAHLGLGAAAAVPGLVVCDEGFMVHAVVGVDFGVVDGAVVGATRQGQDREEEQGAESVHGRQVFGCDV